MLNHDGAVYAARFGPNGQTLFTAADKGVTPIWNPATGKEIASVPSEKKQSLLSFALSPDGQKMAACGEGETIDLLNPVNGAKLASWPSQSPGLYSVTQVVWSADGRQLATCAGRKVIVWDAATHAAVSTIALPEPTTARSIAFSPDGRRLVVMMSGETAGHQMTALLGTFDPATGKQVAQLPFPHVGSMWIAFQSEKILVMRHGVASLMVDMPSGKVVNHFFAERSSFSLSSFLVVL